VIDVPLFDSVGTTHADSALLTNTSVDARFTPLSVTLQPTLPHADGDAECTSGSLSSSS
jgi:hypothetical protein